MNVKSIIHRAFFRFLFVPGTNHRLGISLYTAYTYIFVIPGLLCNPNIINIVSNGV